MRKFLSLLLKATISILLLYLALNWVNVDLVGVSLGRIAPGWLALGELSLLIQMVFGTVRWQQMSIQCGGTFSFGRLFRIGMIAAFFNQTLPSSVGGDAMRIWLLGKQANWRLATYSVLLDRLVGVVALAILVIACLPWTLQLVTNPIGRTALLVIGFGIICGGIIFLALGWSRPRYLQHYAPTRHVVETATVAVQLLHARKVLAGIFTISVMSHFTTVAACWFAAQAVSANLSFTNALFVVLPVSLVAIVPISIAGWGVREGAMVLAFGFAGLPQSDGLVVSILFGLMSLVFGAIGGLVWIVTSSRDERSIATNSFTAAKTKRRL